MSIQSEWDVTVRGRIENVTDRQEFPVLFQAALRKVSEISIVQFDEPTWPHTTLVVVRISANKKKDAESAVRDLVLRVYWRIARELIGGGALGWTLSANAVLSPSLDPK